MYVVPPGLLNHTQVAVLLQFVPVGTLKIQKICWQENIYLDISAELDFNLASTVIPGDKA